MTEKEAAELEKLFQKQSEDKLTEFDTRHLIRLAAKRAAEHHARLANIGCAPVEEREAVLGRFCGGMAAVITVGLILYCGVRKLRK